MAKDIVLGRVFLMKDLLPAHLEVQKVDVLEKPIMLFPTLGLKTKLITSQSTFRRISCGMVVYKVQLSYKLK